MNNNNHRKDGDKKREQQSTHGFLLNEKIKEHEVRVINSDGANLGVISRNEAINIAVAEGFDLVQISKDANGVVTAKIMDFGKFLYEKKKIQNETRKKTKTIEIKEVKFRPNIDVGDYDLKVQKIVDFLKEGDHVKITLQFRGRELSLKNSLGPTLFDRIINDTRSRLVGFALDYQKEIGMGSVWTKVLVARKK